MFVWRLKWSVWTIRLPIRIDSMDILMLNSYDNEYNEFNCHEDTRSIQKQKILYFIAIECHCLQLNRFLVLCAIYGSISLAGTVECACFDSTWSGICRCWTENHLPLCWCDSFFLLLLLYVAHNVSHSAPNYEKKKYVLSESLGQMCNVYVLGRY